MSMRLLEVLKCTAARAGDGVLSELIQVASPNCQVVRASESVGSRLTTTNIALVLAMSFTPCLICHTQSSIPTSYVMHHARCEEQSFASNAMNHLQNCHVLKV